MRRAWVASFGVALALALVGCGGEGAQPAADKGDVYVQVRGALTGYDDMQVWLTSDLLGESATITLTHDGSGIWTGSRTNLTPGTWTAQLEGYLDWSWVAVGAPITIEITAGATAEAIFLVPSTEQTEGTNPRITNVVISNREVSTYDSITVEVTLAAGGTYTVTGSAPAAAGSFGAATGTGPCTLASVSTTPAGWARIPGWGVRPTGPASTASPATNAQGISGTGWVIAWRWTASSRAAAARPAALATSTQGSPSAIQ